MPDSANSRRYWAYFVAWTAVGLFFLSQDITRRLYWNEPTPWSDVIGSRMIGTYIAAAFTPVILWLGQRWPIDRQNWLHRTALHLLFGSVFSVIELAMEAVAFVHLGLLSSLSKGTFWSAFSALLVVGFHANVITYGTILGILSAYRLYQKYREREQETLRLEVHSSELRTQLMQAQLSALKMQLQPHFLFNTLNAIMVLVRQQKGREAEETLARFSDLLRCVLENVDAQEVPLRRELEYLRLYLSIEEVRFQDRLRVDISADPDVQDAAIPHMALQPIVENAIRHGIGRSSAAGLIQVRASRVNGALEIKVKDDGPGLRPAEQGRGIGLTNTRARLHQLYGDAAWLTIENGEGGGTVVTMVLPYRFSDDVLETQRVEENAADNVDRG